MRNSLRLLFLLAVAAVPAAAAAPVSAAAPGGASASDALTRIESETLVLKARERQLAVKAAIAQRQNEIAGRQDEGARLGSAAPGSSPVVQSLEGIGQHQYATLRFESGAVAEVRAGDVLAGGLRVLSVESNGVIVETARKKRMRLHMAGNAQAPFNPAPAPLPPALARPAVALPPLFPGATGSER
ncbi:type IV pilus biogenesis protein PilP [Massilia atriviolacea]|uniref:Type IV pilus biogenesis protein PilP n=1 Tax=Massilia atriviolacea TaxID=2495579 RepID=A0A430HUB9_9BURK|nr:type IV pilus biogenesis protein PilP [Massilia atriviolacea]RSZ61089.1 type IV pilus biogenesis protein PilP [Massilia atriviolacea]